MGRTKNYIAIIALIACGGTAIAQDYFDDIYYNPKKDSSSKVKESAAKAQQSYYIADMANMDVDAYNRRGDQYYVSEIDTIGSVVENGEDFVYTQQIQKYYNPTIVVDNANLLGDVLSNAYGNVDIIINNNGYPVFGPYNGWNYPYYSSVWNYPYYSTVWNPWNWGWGLSFGGWGWNIGWYDPWYSWGWSPGWWNPRPSWGWRPGWHPGPIGRPGPIATWNPRGNRPNPPRQMPGGVPQHKNVPMRQPSIGSHQTSGNRVPSNSNNVGNMSSSHRPLGVVNNNGKWEYNSSNHRQPENVTTSTPVNSNTAAKKTGTANTTYRTSSSASKSTGTVTNKTTTSTNTNNRSMTTNRSSFGTTSRSTGTPRNSGGGNRGGNSGGGRHR